MKKLLCAVLLLCASLGAQTTTKLTGMGIVKSTLDSSPVGATTPSTGAFTWVNGVCVASGQSGADAGVRIAACNAALPAAGGVADARGLSGAQAWTANPFIYNKPLEVRLGASTNTVTVPIRVGGGANPLTGFGAGGSSFGNNQRLLGVGSRGSIFRVDAAFPISSSVLSLGKTAGTFSSVISDVYVDCKPAGLAAIAGCTALDIDGAQEGSEAHDLVIANATQRGIIFRTNGTFDAASTQNTGVRNFQLGTLSTANATGIEFGNTVGGRMYAHYGTISTSDGGNSTGDAILSNAGGSAQLELLDIHCEGYTNCIHQKTGNPVVSFGTVGHSSITNLVYVDSPRTGYLHIGLFGNGAGTTINDQTYGFTAGGNCLFALSNGTPSAYTNTLLGDCSRIIFSPPASANPAFAIQRPSGWAGGSSAFTINPAGAALPAFDIHNDGDTALTGILYVKPLEAPCTAPAANCPTVSAPNGTGASMTSKCSAELVTIAAAAFTDSPSNLLPADSLIESVDWIVVTAIPTAATFSVGDATVAGRFKSGISVNLGTKGVGHDQWKPTNADNAGPVQDTAAKVRITPNLQPLAATGQVRIVVCARTSVAPTL